MIEVRLLGPPRVLRDGELVALDTRKAMALLAYLAVPQRARSRDTLADLLWPDADAERARGALRRTLTSLRAAIGAEHVEATHDHVRLLTGPGLDIDLDRFRALQQAGDHESAVAAVGGEFLEGFAVRDAPSFEEWARVEGEALRRELAGELAAVAQQHEAAGEVNRAIAAVRRWLELDDLHEPAHQALIRLLARAGDRAGAVAQYRTCVRILSRELGVAPLRETTALYEAVNRGSLAVPAETAVASRPMVAGPAPSPFVGRAAELRALRTAYADVHAAGHVAVVEGEPGIGKTRLLEELVAELRAAGARVVATRAYEDEVGVAYGAVAGALRERLGEGADWASAVDNAALTEAARLVPELTPRGAAAAPPAPGADPGAPERFLAGVWATLVASVSGARPGVLVLDDAQWADTSTQDLLGYGLRRLAGRSLLVVLAFRTPAETPLHRLATRAAVHSGHEVVRLGRLGRDDVDALVAATRPKGSTGGLADELWTVSEGVPLLLVEFLHRGGGVGAELPDRMRSVLRARLEPVSETARQVLSAAAVIGRSFDSDIVRAVSGRTDEETVAALEELVARGLVREQSRDYDFAHELQRRLVYEETGLARRRLLHRRAAAAPGLPAAAVARHLRLAGRDAEAAAAHREAARQARAVFANAEALDHLRTALALGHPDRAPLLAEMGDLLAVAGDYPGALTSLEAAAAEAAGAVELADVDHRIGRLHHRRGDFASAERHLTHALESTPETYLSTRSSVAADLALTAHSIGDQPRARRLAAEALRLAERSRDDRALSQAHNLLGLLATEDGDADVAVEHLQASRALADQTGDRDMQVAALNNLALAHRGRGEIDLALDLTATALNLCASVGDRHREAALHNNLADLLHASGRAAEAMEHLTAAVRLFAEVGAEQEPQPGIWKLVRW